MKNDNKLNEKDLDNVVGGSDLEKYLKQVTGNDKNKILVDEGTGKELKLDSTIDYDKADNLIIIKREKKKIEDE